MSELDEEKKFYERFWALLSDAQLMAVFARFGPSAFRRSSVLEGFESFIREQPSFRGECCVEIGTLKGLTALVLSRYFDRVVSIDIKDDPVKYEIAQMLGVQNVEFVNVTSNAGKANIIRALRFDGAYVDGDHTNDTETDFELVKHTGRVLFHEQWDAQPAVVRLVNRIGGRVQQSGKFALWTA